MTDSPRAGSSSTAIGENHQSSPRPSVASRTSKCSHGHEVCERHDSGTSLNTQHSRKPSRATLITTSSPLPATALPPPAPALSQQQAPTPFAPLFTLLTSTSHPSGRQSTHQPTVRYVFADDDPDILTAALDHHTLGPRDPQKGFPGRRDDEDTGEHQNAQSTVAAGKRRLQTSEASDRERAVLLDLVPARDVAVYEVGWASSLAPDWAVVSAKVVRMGSGGFLGTSAGRRGAGKADDDREVDNAAGGASDNQDRESPPTLMLQIDGVSVEPGFAVMPEGVEADVLSSGSGGSVMREAKGKSKGKFSAEQYAALVEDFEKRMNVLKRVVEAEEERQRVMGHKVTDERVFGAAVADNIVAAQTAHGDNDNSASR